MSRPIDAELLKKVIKSNHYLLRSVNNSMDYGMFTCGVIQAIDDAPTVEPKKGEWIDSYLIEPPKLGEALVYHRCTSCMKWSVRLFGCAEYTHCPYCGADMRGDTNE